MLYTMRVDYFNDKTADQVIAAIETVLDDVSKNGITAAELAQAKTTMRSSFFDDMEGGGDAAVRPRQPARGVRAL